MVSGALSHFANEGAHSCLGVPLRRSSYETPDAIETTER